MKLYVATACMVLAASIAFADAADAQAVRQSTPEPKQQPGIQKPAFDPSSQAMSALNLKVDALQQKVDALQLKLDALQESAGRQVVVLDIHIPESGRPEDKHQTLYQRALSECSQALGSRYGRMIGFSSIKIDNVSNLQRAVCETAL